MTDCNWRRLLAGLLALSMGLCARAEPVDPARPLRLAHVSLGNVEYYLPLPPAFAPAAAGKASGSVADGFWLHFFPEGQTEQNWTERLTFAVFTPDKHPLGIGRGVLAHACTGMLSSYDAPAPVFLTLQPDAKAAVVNCSETERDGGPTIYGYYLGMNTADHAWLLSHERREGHPDHYADWGAGEVDHWRRIMAGFTVCAKGAVCIRYPEKTTVLELGSGQ